MEGKYLGFVLGAAIGFETLLNPIIGDAFYVSQRERQKGGINLKDITENSLPLGKNASYDGTTEDESFPEIARRVNNGAKKRFTIELRESMTYEILAEFNNYKGLEMPSVSVPCDAQYHIRLTKKLVEKIEQQRKSGYAEEAIKFLETQLEKLNELYKSEITDLKENYLEHEKRIEELEGRPGQKDYSKEIEELRGENRELRKMIGGMEKEYSQAGQEYSKPGNAPPEYVQPVQPPAGSNGVVVIGQPGWLLDIPYPYKIVDGSVSFWSGLGWTYWGILEPYGFGFRGRRWDGRFFDYYGPRDLPFYGHYKNRSGFLDGRYWGARGKHFDIHPDLRHGRGERRPDFHDRRFEVSPRNLPERHPEQGRREFRPQAPPNNLPRGHPNTQFNQPRGGVFRGPQAPLHGGFRGGGSSAPQRGLGNPGGRGMQSRPQSRGQR